MADDQNYDDYDDGLSGAVITRDRIATKRPSLYKVLLHNDNYTPMDFVVDVLEMFFKKNHAEANDIMLAVHEKGMGICGVFPYEVAETKVAQVTEAAKDAQHPLKCTMERA
jgi:ATP-dependent Clp protease adaptor protein ClpS